MTLEDRTCVVTGASRGIGRGIAKEFGRHGASVAVNYRSSEAAAHEVVDAIEETGGEAIAVQADVADNDAVAGMAEAVRSAFGPADVLVNNAGLTVDRTFKNMTPEDWQRVVDVNLGGMYNCTHQFFEDIVDADCGRLINISSVVGQQGNYGQANYATTKSGMFGFTRTIALELARTGSTANCVAPGFVRTDMLDEVSDHVQEQILERIPLERFAEVDDITGIVRFVASEDSGYMTGQILAVNGGMEW
ncbi:beta-ketoacyl-ACP reductase [Halococcus hamelinensis]|uniref:3-oxoacyl-ACP reductase n=1 Tax=Halococcus hamelinensis 100A6 TaxID=1132509 RepID=M0LUA6_9EURY|nr:beta-ketoacyl-ACP reductase [Halococcus hamelinensis]EMA36753.1 3-oxoacyl-ACP reductase [Halococcus hamelinensis 100A6]